MDLSGIAFIYVAAFGAAGALVVVGVAWLVWAWRADHRDARL